MHKFYIINKNALLYFHKLPIENHEKVWYTIGEERRTVQWANKKTADKKPTGGNTAVIRKR